MVRYWRFILCSQKPAIGYYPLLDESSHPISHSHLAKCMNRWIARWVGGCLGVTDKQLLSHFVNHLDRCLISNLFSCRAR
jgi:hypothetical protein